MGGDFNVGVTRLGKGQYAFEEAETYEEYEILKNNQSNYQIKKTHGFQNLEKAVLILFFIQKELD